VPPAGRRPGRGVATVGRVSGRLVEVEHDGLVFDVVDGGPLDGEVVVLLHGFPQDASSWDAISPALHLAGFRTLAPQQRGYCAGARPVGVEHYRLGRLVGDVLALLDAAGVEQSHLVGHDWGAGVAWAVAANHPDRVRTVTSLSVPHPRAMTAAAARGQALRSWYFLLFQVPGLAERLLRPGSWMWRQAVRGLPAASAQRFAIRMAEPGALTAALSWYRALPADQSDPSVRVGRIEVPTLFVWGTRDPALGRAAALATSRFVTGPYRFEALPGAGHWLPDAHADRVVPVLLDHLGRSH
jgi:pimeloyl-ACP methyl ester carboxylesterase